MEGQTITPGCQGRTGLGLQAMRTLDHSRGLRERIVVSRAFFLPS
jgi:hypothetical protein